MKHSKYFVSMIYMMVICLLMPLMAMAQVNNAVKRDFGTNQMHVVTIDNDVTYYNTNDVKEVKFYGSKITVKANGTASDDVFGGNASEVGFSLKAKPAASGVFANDAGEVEIAEARGWQESLYVEWKPMDGADSYNVYVKGGQYADYTRIDRELVRNYGSYARADVLGLKADGGYSVKVVPVAGGKEIEEAANEATDMNVVNYSREGFAHLNYSGIGAYNDDGTLKSNAKVLYITAETAKTVTTTVLVGKNMTEITGLQSILDAYQKGTDTTPLAIRIIGKITKEDLDHISSSAEGLQVKGKNKYSEMNITLEGVGEDATISGFGILARNCKGVEFRNFAIMMCMDDCLSLDTGNSNIWIHNMDYFYGNAGSDKDQAKGDGTVDLKAGTKYVTISYNRFWDSGKSSLCGMGSDEANYITYHHNWFDHSDSRHPRIRCMSVHIWNNYYDGVAKYGVGVTSGASAFVEANYYRNCNKPMLISMQGSDTGSDGKGTFSSEDGGVIKSYGNIFTERTKNFKYVTYQQNNVEFDAYEAKTRSEEVPAEVKAKKGGTSYDNFDTTDELMYSYAPQAAVDVPENVTGAYGAGRMNHGDFIWDFTGKDADYDVDTALKTALQNYKSSLVGIF
ncbi:MAG: polysaccharide lyase family 1 protein [Prevotella sp.]